MGILLSERVMMVGKYGKWVDGGLKTSRWLRWGNFLKREREGRRELAKMAPAKDGMDGWMGLR